MPNVGSTVISISNITNLSTLCTNVVTLSKDFVVNPLPDVTTVSLSVNSACQGKPIIVMVSGLGVLSSVVLRYNLSGANSVNNQSVSLTATNGNASFEIPTPLQVLVVVLLLVMFQKALLLMQFL